MNRIDERPLWYGGVGALRHPAMLHETGVEAVVFLAADLFDPPGRESIVCRVPLVDGAGNAPCRLRLAVDIAAALIAGDVPTLVCCSNGMSRSPAIVAAALATVDGGSPDEHLKRIALGRAADVSPALWREVLDAIARGLPAARDERLNSPRIAE